MKLLITGATGFIGQHLVARLQASGHSITAIVRPATDVSVLKQKNVAVFEYAGSVSALTEFMSAEKFDGVFHLASLFLAQHKPEDIAGLVESNVTFSTQVLESTATSKIPWFINTGTFWQHYQNATYAPVNLYAATKEAFIDIAQYYIETSNVHFTTLKLSDTFGPNDPRPKVMNLMARIGTSKEHLDMSPGEQLIDISYIDNVLDAFMQLMKLVSADGARAMSGKSYGVSSGQALSLKDLAAVFEKVTGLKLDIGWGGREYRPREVMIPWETYELVPGWEPKVSLEEGIKKTFSHST
jgi:nucleoside-diphosphate-sugar epimerase